MLGSTQGHSELSDGGRESDIRGARRQVVGDAKGHQLAGVSVRLLVTQEVPNGTSANRNSPAASAAVVRVGKRSAVSVTVAPPSGAPADVMTLPNTTDVDGLVLWAAYDTSTDRHTTTTIEAARMLSPPAWAAVRLHEL
jgi:hypothetical protein